MPIAHIEPNLVQRAREAFARHSRLLNRLMRERLNCGPVTVQQCYALEALATGSLSMKLLSRELALHQSTVTRIVDKLEHQGLVARTRRLEDQRSVTVEITDAGRATYAELDRNSNEMIGSLLAMVPAGERESLVSALETLTRILEPSREPFRLLLDNCCGAAQTAVGDQ